MLNVERFCIIIYYTNFGTSNNLYYRYYGCPMCVCASVRSFLPPRASRPRNIGTYRIAGIFRGGKFSRKPLQLYYSNYSRAEFSRNAPSSAKNYPFCTELTVRAALCNHTLARHLFAG